MPANKRATPRATFTNSIVFFPSTASCKTVIAVEATIYAAVCVELDVNKPDAASTGMIMYLSTTQNRKPAATPINNNCPACPMEFTLNSITVFSFPEDFALLRYAIASNFDFFFSGAGGTIAASQLGHFPSF